VQFTRFSFQLQLWLDKPLQQLTFKNTLPQIEAPYNSVFNFGWKKKMFANFSLFQVTVLSSCASMPTWSVMVS
jgi:hypothetical protein